VHLDIAPEAVWADGMPISGEDFRFTYDTVMRPDVLVDKSGYDLIDPGSLVVGEKSFEFRLVGPSLVVESLFPVLLPAHVVGPVDVMSGSWEEDMWISGGPFEFEEWSRGEFITLVRNPNYWKVDDAGQSLPYLDRVVFRFVPDEDTLLAEFEARHLDVITPSWDPALLDRLSALSGVSVDVAGSGQWEHVTFQFGDGRFVRNPGSYNEHLEYRLAVAHAIDRQGVVDAVLGGWGKPLDSYVEAFTPAWSQGAWAKYDYDPDKARDYLTALCAKDGVDCAANPPTAVLVTTEQRGDLALALESMFTAVGIEYRSELEPRVIFLGETIEFGTFDLGDWTWVGTAGLRELAALHRVWDPEQAPPIGSNYYRLGSPGYHGEGDLLDYQEGPSSLLNEHTARMAEIYDLLGATVDEREVLALVAEAETILAEQLVFIPLYELPDAGVVWADEIGGYRHHPSEDTWNVATWNRIDG
jgi:peptide/nickel transport system substrate-binding protein